MLTDELIQKTLSNEFTPVMWKYDGLGGKVIKWTKAHGNTSDDPAHRIWILDAEGREIARAEGEAESPSSLTAWLTKAIETWKKSKLPGIAHLFTAPPEGADPLIPAAKARIVWYAAAEVEGASPEWNAAVLRTNALAEKVLASRKLEAPTRTLELWRVDATPTDDAAKLPRIVVLGALPAEAKPDAKPAPKFELSGASLTLDELVATLGKLPKSSPK